MLSFFALSSSSSFNITGCTCYIDDSTCVVKNVSISICIVT